MTAHRHLDKKRLFALMDAGEIPRDAAAHLEQCRLCRDRHARLKALRRAAIDTAKPSMRDWSQTDKAIRAEIKALCSAPRRSKASWRLPSALALTSAAAVILALAVNFSAPRVEPRPEQNIARLDELETARTMTARPETQIPDPAGRIAAKKWDAVPLSSLPMDDKALKPGETCATGEGQSVRIALDGGPAKLELEQQTALAALSLNIEDPQLYLEGGTTVIDIPVESQIVSLRVLAGGADFLIDEAEVTFHVREDGLEVIVHRGEILALGEDDPLVLAPGRYARSATQEPSADLWVPIPREFQTPAPDQPGSLSLDERRVRNTLRGHLPLSEVRKTMSTLRPALRRCYETALKRDSNLILAMQARLKVARDGGVTDVSIDGLAEHPTLQGCVESIFTEARFPPPRGGPVRIVVPLKLYPRR